MQIDDGASHTSAHNSRQRVGSDDLLAVQKLITCLQFAAPDHFITAIAEDLDCLCAHFPP